MTDTDDMAMKRTQPPAGPAGSEAADKAFESWFKGLRLDDVVCAACAKVPKKTLRMVFMAGRYYRPRGSR